jgi:hypothetical protein
MATAIFQELPPIFETLSNVSPDEVFAGLQARQAEAHHAYLKEHATPRLWREDLHQSILDIGLIALVKEEFNPNPTPTRILSIGINPLPLARADLRAFIAEDPQAREFLVDTVVFDEDHKTEQRIIRAVIASIAEKEPHGRYELAAGVATGITTARVYNPRYLPLTLVR